MNKAGLEGLKSEFPKWLSQVGDNGSGMRFPWRIQSQTGAASRDPLVIDLIWRQESLFKSQFIHWGASLPLPGTAVLSGDLDAAGWAAVMAAKGLAAAR